MSNSSLNYNMEHHRGALLLCFITLIVDTICSNSNSCQYTVKITSPLLRPTGGKSIGATLFVVVTTQDCHWTQELKQLTVETRDEATAV